MKKLLLLAAFVFGSTTAHADMFDGVMVNGFDIYSIRQAAPVEEWIIPNYTSQEKSTILKSYDHLDPRNLIETNALEDAVLFFHANKSKIPNKNFIPFLKKVVVLILEIFIIYSFDHFFLEFNILRRGHKSN